MSNWSLTLQGQKVFVKFLHWDSRYMHTWCIHTWYTDSRYMHTWCTHTWYTYSRNMHTWCIHTWYRDSRYMHTCFMVGTARKSCCRKIFHSQKSSYTNFVHNLPHNLLHLFFLTIKFAFGIFGILKICIYMGVKRSKHKEYMPLKEYMQLNIS